MVKGNTRQVIVVKSPDPKLFEQAIFLLREDALEKHGVGERELLEEARRVANGFVLHNAPAKKHRRLAPRLGGNRCSAGQLGLAAHLAALIRSLFTHIGLTQEEEGERTGPHMDARHRLIANRQDLP